MVSCLDSAKSGHSTKIPYFIFSDLKASFVVDRINDLLFLSGEVFIWSGSTSLCVQVYYTFAFTSQQYFVQELSIAFRI